MSIYGIITHCLWVFAVTASILYIHRRIDRLEELLNLPGVAAMEAAECPECHHRGRLEYVKHRDRFFVTCGCKSSPLCETPREALAYWNARWKNYNE